MVLLFGLFNYFSNQYDYIIALNFFKSYDMAMSTRGKNEKYTSNRMAVSMLVLTVISCKMM